MIIKYISHCTLVLNKCVYVNGIHTYPHRYTWNFKSTSFTRPFVLHEYVICLNHIRYQLVDWFIEFIIHVIIIENALVIFSNELWILFCHMKTNKKLKRILNKEKEKNLDMKSRMISRIIAMDEVELESQWYNNFISLTVQIPLKREPA